MHLYPHRRVPDLTALDEDQRAEFPRLDLDLPRRFDRLLGGGRTPYISAWHQAPRGRRAELALHLELFTIRRTADKLTYLAGVESGMDAFANDVSPEHAPQRLWEAAPRTLTATRGRPPHRVTGGAPHCGVRRCYALCAAGRSGEAAASACVTASTPARRP